MNVLIPLIIKYLEANPAQVEQLVAALIQALIQHIQSQPAAPPAA